MDEFLAVVGVQAMRYAIRSGIALTSTYALGQCSRLLKSVEDKKLHSQLEALRKLLDVKIKIISPAIDLIEFKLPMQRSGRGNVFLKSAAPLAKSLQKDINSLGRRIEGVAVVEENLNASHTPKKESPTNVDSLEDIIATIEALLARIDREIPLLQLAISASGENLSTSVPAGISPSRLLQASTFLTVGDTQFAHDPSRPVQIGPVFTISLYMLFLGHASTLAPPKIPDASNVEDTTGISNGTAVYGLEDGARKPLWQEVLHKARVRLCRTRWDYAFNSIEGYQPSHGGCPDSSDTLLSPTEAGQEYMYHLEIIENLDDGRLHDDGEGCRPYDDIALAGIRESIPIHQVSKIFYTDTGKILNIGAATDGDHSPVLLLKRDVQAVPSWRNVNEFSEYLEDTASEDGSISLRNRCDNDEQAAVDKQLFQESIVIHPGDSVKSGEGTLPKYKFPSHLDPEWLALEVYEEDQDDGVMDEEDGSAGSDMVDELENAIPKQSVPRDRKSLDSKVVDQLKRLSLQSLLADSSPSPLSSPKNGSETQGFVARSPFRAITTSLSLMEMLIRLTSLQEFQQASHLSIPDHILSFFLEETSTTGLVGETQWRVRTEAKRRVGFDPYTDAPVR
ncbi:RanGTP-binding protein-domain-containing protein [Mariannaea sp. PMI_226]|nr:RanGTP-binding protein-domain-containing protein [Mariannaea sp. PMI_226]